MSNDVVPMAEAAKRIGRPSWWLRRYLLDYERRTGHAVLARKGRGRKRPTYDVHMGRLRSLCPELFDPRDQIAAALRESLIVGRREMQEQRDRTDEIDEKLLSIAQLLRQIQHQLGRR